MSDRMLVAPVLLPQFTLCCARGAAVGERMGWTSYVSDVVPAGMSRSTYDLAPLRPGVRATASASTPIAVPR